jgi:diazepam-binding inhibitor (GABA receptor modulating acyl-CoA-binding protein)
MTNTYELFKQSTEDVMELLRIPTNEERLDVYALYKQATIGCCNTKTPMFWDVKDVAKWNAWNAKKGISRDLAKTLYIRLIGVLKIKYGFNETQTIVC